MAARARFAAVLFDWGDTLVHFPGLTTTPDWHRACVRQFYDELAAEGHAECFAARALDWPRFLAAYDASAATLVEGYRTAQREERLETRLAAALVAAGCECALDATVYEEWSAGPTPPAPFPDEV